MQIANAFYVVFHSPSTSRGFQMIFFFYLPPVQLQINFPNVHLLCVCVCLKVERWRLSSKVFAINISLESHDLSTIREEIITKIKHIHSVCEW